MKYTIGSLIISIIVNWFLSLFIGALIFFISAKASIPVLIYFGKTSWVQAIYSNYEIIFGIISLVFWYLLTLEDFFDYKGFKYFFNKLFMKVNLT